jgi:hypothetical protein
MIPTQEALSMRFDLRPLALIALVVLATHGHAAPLKADEEVLFFRTVADIPAGSSSWTMPVRGWVFEPERNSITRRLLMKALAKALGLPSGSDAQALFQSRAEMFLVDSERKKTVAVNVGGVNIDMPETTSDGMFSGIVVAPVFGGEVGSGRWVRFAAKLPPPDPRRFEGELQLVGSEGLGVISDIDDTIKVTVVLDKKEALRNTFLRPFQPVAGMAKAYERWAQAGAVFHYVSGSPWPLYPSLVKWMDETGYPMGGYHLRTIWSAIPKQEELTGSAAEHKIPAISRILALHPKRTFVLVGDSGEADPEIYGEIARRHPGRIRKIHIRKAPHAVETDERYQKAFHGLPRTLWSVFAEPQVALEP